MAETKQLGIFWGNDALYFTETEATNPKKLFHISFREENKATIKDGPLSPGGMELIADIQNTLRKEKVTTSTAHLSLPTKDIIFRSFTIPWMQQHEIKSVVEFEVSKYIPFSLEELSFSFHPITITENNTKRLHIIFVAIKNDVLENYTKILEDAALSVNIIEPAASSLIRILSLKGLIPKDQTVALIEKEDVGRIIVVDGDIPQFVREFHLSTATVNQPEKADLDAVVKRLTREVRISLDYFNRQNEQLQVKQILLLTSSHLEELHQDLEKNLDMPVVAIDDKSILEDASQREIGFLNAYGASIIPSTDSPIHFNLSKQESKPTKSTAPVPKKPINYKLIIKTALACIPLIIISILVSGFLTQKLKKDINTLNQKLGAFQDADTSMIEQQELILKARLTYFENTRMQSDAALFLLLIPDLLPEGTWIQNLDVIYDDSVAFNAVDTVQTKNEKKKSSGTRKAEATSPLTVTIDGYAYSENKNKQFRLVNALLKNLKDNKEFSNFFQDIDLQTTQAKELGEYPVTSFKIVCKQSHELKRSE